MWGKKRRSASFLGRLFLGDSSRKTTQKREDDSRSRGRKGKLIFFLRPHFLHTQLQKQFKKTTSSLHKEIELAVKKSFFQDWQFDSQGTWRKQFAVAERDQSGNQTEQNSGTFYKTQTRPITILSDPEKFFPETKVFTFSLCWKLYSIGRTSIKIIVIIFLEGNPGASEYVCNVQFSGKKFSLPLDSLIISPPVSLFFSPLPRSCLGLRGRRRIGEEAE